MDDNLSRFVPNVYFEQIPIKNLVSNQDYQRNLSETNILKAAEFTKSRGINQSHDLGLRSLKQLAVLVDALFCRKKFFF